MFAFEKHSTPGAGYTGAVSLKCSFCVQHWIDIFVRLDLRGSAPLLHITTLTTELAPFAPMCGRPWLCVFGCSWWTALIRRRSRGSTRCRRSSTTAPRRTPSANSSRPDERSSRKSTYVSASALSISNHCYTEIRRKFTRTTSNRL